MSGHAGKIRNIFLVGLVWPLITLGIYHLVWYYKVNREAQDFDQRIEVNPAMAVLAITLGWLVIVPPSSRSTTLVSALPECSSRRGCSPPATPGSESSS